MVAHFNSLAPYAGDHNQERIALVHTLLSFDNFMTKYSSGYNARYAITRENIEIYSASTPSTLWPIILLQNLPRMLETPDTSKRRFCVTTPTDSQNILNIFNDNKEINFSITCQFSPKKSISRKITLIKVSTNFIEHPIN